MHAANSVIFLATALLLTVDHLTLLARPATSVVRLVTYLVTAPRRLPMATLLVMLSILGALLQWLHLLRLSYRYFQDRRRFDRPP